ncbi:MAG: class I SAM-dependent rRNA methyltransferase [Deltaproteobacteria bacterium]|nr:class I SAM-dependent rRNA methyltransferase [Deltaproteobacteria bacterium]
MADILLHSSRDRSVRRRHPWVLSGAVARVDGSPEPGDLVRVLSAEGEVLGHGHYSPHSQIRVRLLEMGKESEGEALLAARITAAVERRRADSSLEGCDAVRLVHAEGDGLPGLVADRYGDTVVLRVGTAGMARRRDELADALAEATGVACVYERGDAAALRREGEAVQEGPLRGEAPKAPIAITERGRSYRADVVNGQKTGFYLDQREARSLVERLAPGRRVLDLFCYSGGFALAAAKAGAKSIVAVDGSKQALELGESSGADVDWVKADAFRFLRAAEPGFDLLVIDPPPLARRKNDVKKASRGYKDLMMHGLRCAAPGAQLLVFACSHHVGPDLFRKIVFGASLDAERPVRVLGELGAPPDHPVALDHPEGRYLTGLWLEAIG